MRTRREPIPERKPVQAEAGNSREGRWGFWLSRTPVTAPSETSTQVPASLLWLDLCQDSVGMLICGTSFMRRVR
ncbi:hypothetical protein ADL05_17920 [Nocardiopsis sp. NRRL B-16309]|nr:hypothetical protein ADL05_17920 [Nocardiopsis sp. NRRL B-16309]